MTSPARRELYAGVMSGTSLDGVDAVLVDFPPGAALPVLVCGTHVDFPSALRRDLLALQASGPDEIARAARAANVLADLYAHALKSVCQAASVAAHEVVAAGVHGQTIRHRPEEGWTTQINNPSRVAEGAYMSFISAPSVLLNVFIIRPGVPQPRRLWGRSGLRPGFTPPVRKAYSDDARLSSTTDAPSGSPWFSRPSITEPT